MNSEEHYILFVIHSFVHSASIFQNLWLRPGTELGTGDFCKEPDRHSGLRQLSGTAKGKESELLKSARKEITGSYAGSNDLSQLGQEHKLRADGISLRPPLNHSSDTISSQCLCWQKNVSLLVHSIFLYSSVPVCIPMPYYIFSVVCRAIQGLFIQNIQTLFRLCTYSSKSISGIVSHGSFAAKAG